MTSQDFLFYALGTGFLVLVGFLSYAAYCLGQALRELTPILEKVEDITRDVDQLKDKIKEGILYLLKMFVKKRGGDKHGK